MARALTPAELDALLGAHALDAVEPEERVQVEAWLARSPAARREVDELREAASLLAHAGDAPPDDLWSRIEARLGEPERGSPPDAPPLRIGAVVDLAERRAPTVRRRPWRLAVAAACGLAVAAAAGVLVGSRLADQDARIDRLAAGMEERAMERAALTASMEPDSRNAALVDDRGRARATVVLTAEGRGYLVADDLPALPAGRTYQLWAVMGTAPGAPVVSAGVMGRAPAVMAFSADSAVTGFVVTEEATPGAATSRGAPMLRGEVA